jgi:hypothetical protein
MTAAPARSGSRWRPTPAVDQRSPSASPVDTQNIQICTASVLTGIELTSAQNGGYRAVFLAFP